MNKYVFAFLLLTFALTVGVSHGTAVLIASENEKLTQQYDELLALCDGK